MIIFPTNGRRNQVYAANWSSADENRNNQQLSKDISVITYDHPWKHVTNYWLSSLVPDTWITWKTLIKPIPYDVFNISTKYHRVINKVNKNQDKVIWDAEATDMDNHDDTSCFYHTLIQYHSIFRSALYLF